MVQYKSAVWPFSIVFAEALIAFLILVLSTYHFEPSFYPQGTMPCNL